MPEEEEHSAPTAELRRSAKKQARKKQKLPWESGKGDCFSAWHRASSSTAKNNNEIDDYVGWKAVDIGDGLLLGASEGGFQGLEELDLPAELINDANRASDSFEPSFEESQVEDAPAVEEDSRGRKRKAKSQKLRPNAAATSSGKLEELQAKLAEVEAENARLKKCYASLAKPCEGEKQGLGVGLEEEEAGKESGSVDALEAGPEETSRDERALNHRERKKLKRKAFLAAQRQEAVKQKRKAQKQLRKLRQSEPAGKAASVPEQCKSEEPEEMADVDMAAWSPFELNEQIIRALASLGFASPTPIQEACLPAAIRDRRDVIGAAQTGSGKTLAFGLPIIQALLDERNQQKPDLDAQDDAQTAAERCLRALILAPTRELALQVSAHIQAVGKPCGVWCIPIVGGIAQAKQERLLEVRPEIVVATPGRLWEMMREGDSHLTNFSRLSFLVLDEADRMVQQGHFEELSNILDFVPRPSQKDKPTHRASKNGKQVPAHDHEDDLAPEDQPDLSAAMAVKPGRKLQTFVFSATLTMPASLRKRLRKGGGGAAGSASLENLMDKIPFREKPKIADLTSERRLADKVVESYLECAEEDRDGRLYYMLTQHPGRTLVFANAISTVRRLAAILRLLQLPVVALHASMQQRQRLKALDRFKHSNTGILVATDVAARGLDIQGVACVIHYQIPAAVDVYVHRCGRTARAEAEGVSVALVTPKESARFSALLKAMGRQPPPLFPLDQNLLPEAQKRVRLATKLDEKVRLRSKTAAHKTWETHAADAAGIDLSDSGEELEEVADARMAQLQEELAQLIQQPLQPKFSQRYFAGTPSAALLSKLETGNDEEEAVHQSSSAVAQAVAHASRLADARKSAAAVQQQAAQKQSGKAKKKKKANATATATAQQKAVRAAIAKRQTQKGSPKGRFVVIPGAVGRETEGPNALQALRSKLAGMQH